MKKTCELVISDKNFDIKIKIRENNELFHHLEEHAKILRTKNRIQSLSEKMEVDENPHLKEALI